MTPREVLLRAAAATWCCSMWPDLRMRSATPRRSARAATACASSHRSRSCRRPCGLVPGGPRAAAAAAARPARSWCSPASPATHIDPGEPAVQARDRVAALRASRAVAADVRVRRQHAGRATPACSPGATARRTTSTSRSCGASSPGARVLDNRIFVEDGDGLHQRRRDRGTGPGAARHRPAAGCARGRRRGARPGGVPAPRRQRPGALALGHAPQPPAPGGAPRAGRGGARPGRALGGARAVGGGVHQRPQPRAPVRRARPLLAARLRAADPLRARPAAGDAEPAGPGARGDARRVSLGAAPAARVVALGSAAAERAARPRRCEAA